MKDRYLFKAKRIDNGEWVQGALFDGENHCIIGQEIKFNPYVSNECKIVGYEVDRNTLCQCTSLKDKNGNLIWENDICRYYNAEYEMHEVFKIVWDYEEGRFLSLEVVADSEVIGSFIDIPELLEVQQ